MELNLIRAFLGITQLATAWLVWRRDVGYCFSFMLAMVAGGIFNLAPARPLDETWKHWVQVPSYAVMLALTIAATVEVFAFTRRRTFPRERRLMLGASAALAGAVLVAGWTWQPANWYQAFMVARQYALVALCVGYSASWVWVTCGRPLRMCGALAEHGVLWGIWLIAAALLSSTTKGGLWQIMAPMTVGATWRTVGAILLLAQIWLCAGFALNLQRWRGGLRAS